MLRKQTATHKNAALVTTFFVMEQIKHNSGVKTLKYTNAAMT